MRLLVIRTSAMGDVALTTPVLRAMRQQYPDIELLLLTRPAFKPFFSEIPGLEFFNTDFKNRHKGFSGLIRLYSDLKKDYEIDYVIDLHDVLRTKFLHFLFRISGTPVSVIFKGRNEKRSLLKGKKKIQLKHAVERYCDAFAKAGFRVVPVSGSSIFPARDTTLNSEFVLQMQGVINIGVAPYAKHILKMWPENNMIRLLNLIAEKYKCRFWFFGGNEDTGKLKDLTTRVPRSVSLAGELSLSEELLFMSKLEFMIAMDSSNMHMAALVGTKVISIWGGTDPLAGFSAWMQPDSFSIRVPVEDLDCRPCTIYGKGKTRNDFACMNLLTAELVFKRIEKLILSDYNEIIPL